MARSCSFFFFTHARNYISRGEITAGKCGGCIHMYEGVWVYNVAGIQVLRNDRRVCGVSLFFRSAELVNCGYIIRDFTIMMEKRKRARAGLYTKVNTVSAKKSTFSFLR